MITVCDSAKETCPDISREWKRLHWPFEDPAAVEAMNVRMAAFRRIRDQIHGRIMMFLDGFTSSMD